MAKRNICDWTECFTMMADIAEKGVTSGGLSYRIITTLQLADRRGYSLSLSYLSRMLIHGDAREEDVGREINGMLEVSNHDGICCLKGREHLIPETRRRILRNGIVGKKYEAEARRFAGEYATLCPFIRCIAIAGSVASDVFSEEDDIDFNIFVDRKKPLACKSCTPFLPKLICINVIWEESEALPFVRQDAYMAYELLKQKPIFGIDFYRKILAKNMWLKTYFPQIYYRDSCRERMCKGTSTFLGGLYSSHTGITSKPSLCEVGD